MIVKGIKVNGYICAAIKAKGPVLYYMDDFEIEYDICSIYWKVEFGDRIYLIDTGIKNIDYINGTSKSGNEWKRLNDIKRFEKVDYIFPTHLHYDHCSGIYDYDEAEIIITEKSYGNLLDKRYDVLFDEKIFKGDILDRIRKRDKCRIIKTGEEIEEGIEISWVGGHTPCSQAIIFKTSFRHRDKDFQGILFAGDMVFTYRNIDEKLPGGLMYDLMDFYDFYGKYAGGSLMIIPGHDCKAVKEMEKL